MKKSKVLLISMPWAAPSEPSLGLGILSAKLREAKIECHVYEAQVDLLRFITMNTYEMFSQTWALCDFVFMKEFEVEISKTQDKVLDKFITDTQGHVGLKHVKDLKEKTIQMRQVVAPKYIDYIMSKINFDEYSMVGFTCLFDQTLASLAVAKRIKQKYPDILIVFGGYSLTEPIGAHIFATFPYIIDIIACGDGEDIIVPLYKYSIDKKNSLDSIQNITYFKDNKPIKTNIIKSNLELSPTPDYTDFINTKKQLKIEDKVTINTPTYPLETSRGCWWGERTHCVFCGIDEDALRYRKKTPQRVIQQLKEMKEKYGFAVFRLNDYNIPFEYFSNLFPLLKNDNLMFQIEAKSNLSCRNIQAMIDGGVFIVQLGIESFSTNVLNEMKKGVSAIQNIFSIKELLRKGVHVYYNILFGFPNEKEKDYEELIKVIPALYHLIPPGLCIWVQLTRYSPLKDTYGREILKRPLKANWRYQIIFSDNFREKNGICLEKLCYYYENANIDEASDKIKQLYKILQFQWRNWLEGYKSGSYLYYYINSKGELVIHDKRNIKNKIKYIYNKTAAILYKLIDHQILDINSIYNMFNNKKQEIDELLNKMKHDRVIFHENNQYYALAFNKKECNNKIMWWKDSKLTKKITVRNLNAESFMKQG